VIVLSKFSELTLLLFTVTSQPTFYTVHHGPPQKKFKILPAFIIEKKYEKQKTKPAVSFCTNRTCPYAALSFQRPRASLKKEKMN
jgi:hypothetical protein